MKTISLTCLYLILVLPCFGQIEWVSEAVRTSEVKTFVLTSQGHYAINFMLNSEYPVLAAVDGQGEEIFHFSQSFFQEDEYLVDIADIVEMTDSSIAFPKVSYGIDGGGWANFNFVTAIVDKNWQNLQYCWHGIPNTEKAPKAGLLSENNLILYDADYFQTIRLNGECELIWEDFINFQIFDMTVMSDDRLVWASNNGLIVMDDDGNTDSVFPGLMFEKVQSTSFDGIVGLRQDSIFLLSSEFELLKSQGFPADSILN